MPRPLCGAGRPGGPRLGAAPIASGWLKVGVAVHSVAMDLGRPEVLGLGHSAALGTVVAQNFEVPTMLSARAIGYLAAWAARSRASMARALILLPWAEASMATLACNSGVTRTMIFPE